MTSNKSVALRASLAKALEFLERVLATPNDEIQQAAAIQAFKFTYELSWKLLQTKLRDEGVEVATPRAASRAAGDAGMVDNVERWLDYLEARNLTSYTYNDITASQVYAVVSGTFAADVRALLESDES